MPRDSCGVVLAAWRVRRRATESAPPERATQRRSPGWTLERSKGRAAGGIPIMLSAARNVRRKGDKWDKGG